MRRPAWFSRSRWAWTAGCRIRYHPWTARSRLPPEVPTCRSWSVPKTARSGSCPPRPARRRLGSGNGLPPARCPPIPVSPRSPSADVHSRRICPPWALRPWPDLATARERAGMAWVVDQVADLGGALAGLGFPARGAGCRAGGPAAGALCAGCLAWLAGPVRSCWPTPVPAGLPAPFSAADYAGPVRAAIIEHKEHGRVGLARPLGNALGRALRFALDHAAAAPRLGTWRPGP